MYLPTLLVIHWQYIDVVQPMVHGNIHRYIDPLHYGLYNTVVQHCIVHGSWDFIAEQCGMEGEYHHTIHAPWEVGTIVQPMVHGDHVPYLLLYHPCPMKIGTLVQSMHYGYLAINHGLYNSCQGTQSP